MENRARGPGLGGLEHSRSRVAAFADSYVGQGRMYMLLQSPRWSKTLLLQAWPRANSSVLVHSRPEGEVHGGRCPAPDVGRLILGRASRRLGLARVLACC